MCVYLSQISVQSKRVNGSSDSWYLFFNSVQLLHSFFVPDSIDYIKSWLPFSFSVHTVTETEISKITAVSYCKRVILTAHQRITDHCMGVL